MLRMSPFEFLRQSGLASRNLILLRDPYQAGYRRGVSERISSMDQLGESLQHRLEDYPHVKEVYCVGVSAGAMPAMLIGHRLRAITVWSFSARSPSDLWTQRHGHGAAKKSRWSKKLKQRLASLAIRWRRFTNRTATEPFEPAMVDLDLVRRTAEQLAEHNGTTEYRLYYSTSNETDVRIHQLLADCPGVKSCPVDPPRDYPERFQPSWDHMILPILFAQGKLKDVFPAFLPTEVADA